MTNPRRSFRWGLTVRVTVPLLALLGIGTWISLTSAWQQAALVTDRLLAASARVIAEDLRYADGRINADIPPAALEMFASESRDRVVYRVVGPSDRLIAGYGDLALPANTTASSELQPTSYDLVFRSEQMRAVAFPQQVATPNGLTMATVVVAETVKARWQLFISLALGEVALQIALVVLATIFIWIGIGRELRPLLAFASLVRERRPDDLSLLPVDTVQSELHPLVIALNSFMDRLGRAIERQRTFLDTAAHQLRTPLAVLKTQASFGLRSTALAEKDETLRAIDEDLSEMTRLANQLLLLGRLEHDPHSLKLAQIDLSAIARDVVGQLASLALDAGIELALDAPLPAVIAADAGLFRELLMNLVENAILYAGKGAVATIATSQTEGLTALRVVDSGVGVSAADRERLAQRFQRGEAATGVGSGLGLSIVAELTTMFGGTLRLWEPEGGGFAVELSFRAPPSF